jgi:hypothetical protein
MHAIQPYQTLRRYLFDHLLVSASDLSKQAEVLA